MPTYSSQGFSPVTLAGYKTLLEDVFKDALGQDIDVSSETPTGQLVGGLSLLLAVVDESEISLSNAHSLLRSSGIQVDDQLSILNILRMDAQHSTAGVTITGEPGTTVPRGARASTTSGDVFETSSAIVILSSGSASVSMRAVEPGPIVADAGTLTRINDVISGWEGVTNAAAATLGRDVETDLAAKRRQRRHIGRNARGSLAAIEAAVREMEGVSDALVVDNPTNASVNERGETINARSIYVVAEGGSNAAVATAISQSKPAGTPMSGTQATNISVFNAQGQVVGTRAITFSRVFDVPVTATVNITLDAEFPADGTAAILDAIIGYFDTLGISSFVDSDRLRAAIVATPGHTVTSLTVARKTGSGDPETAAGVSLIEKLSLAEADVTINTA